MDPKFVPVIVICDPTGPEFGVSVVIVATAVTENGTPLLGPDGVFTTTFPAVAPAGTAATITVELQLLMVAAVPLNVTELVPCVVPKLAPLIVTSDPTVPWVGVSAEIEGDGGQAAGLHGCVVSSFESDEARAAMRTAAATPPPTPRTMGTVLLPDFAAVTGGCAAASVGRFGGR